MPRLLIQQPNSRSVADIVETIPGIGLKSIAQAIMRAVSTAKLLSVPSKPKRRSRNSIRYGMSVVNMELPAVTIPFTSPMYFLK